jgi:hypothetical protein
VRAHPPPANPAENVLDVMEMMDTAETLSYAGAKTVRRETPQITITLFAPKENTRVETRREVGKTAEERAN